MCGGVGGGPSGPVTGRGEISPPMGSQSPTTIGGRGGMASPGSGGYLPGMSPVPVTGRGAVPGQTSPNAMNAPSTTGPGTGLVGPTSTSLAAHNALHPSPGSVSPSAGETGGFEPMALDFSPPVESGGFAPMGLGLPAPSIPGVLPAPADEAANPLSEAFMKALKTMMKVDTVASMTGVIPPGATTLLGTPIMAMSQFAEGDPNFAPGVSGPEGNAAQGGGPASLPVPGPNSITQPLVQPNPPAPPPSFDQGDYANRLTGAPLTPDQFMALLTQARGF